MRFLLFALLLATLGVNGGSLGKYARVIGPETASNSTYDFIIVGGGIGGLTVADRLTENPDVAVLVIEIGPFDQGEGSVLVPGLYNPFPYLWPNIFSTPQRGLLNKTFFVPMGKVVGGGSTVNAMFFVRDSKEDYEAWNTLGSHGWGWDDLLPYFKKSENFSRPDATFAKARNISWDDSVHGFSGPVHASYSPYDYASGGNFWNAALDVGIPASKEPNAGNATGLFWLLRALDPTTETRSYARIAHYERVIGSRPNYHLLAENAVSKVIFKGKRAVGVQYITRSNGHVNTAFAKKEVVVSAGAVHSPQILQLSGIGPKSLLQSFNIDVIVDSPGVGQNLQEHLTVQVDYNFSSNIEPNGGSLDSNATYEAEQAALYASAHQGAYTLIRGTGNDFVSLALKSFASSYKAIANLARSQNPASLLPPGTDSTVLNGYIAQRKVLLQQLDSYDSSVATISWNTGPATSLYMVKPFSRGSINIASTDVLVDPTVDFGSVTDPTDLEMMVAVYKKNREIMAAAPMQALGPTEISPAPGITDEDQLREAIRAAIEPANAHECCTLQMSKFEYGGVVDSELRVYGVTGLSVADISIFPLIPTTGPSASVYMLGEKAADMIKKRHGI